MLSSGVARYGEANLAPAFGWKNRVYYCITHFLQPNLPTLARHTRPAIAVVAVTQFFHPKMNVIRLDYDK